MLDGTQRCGAASEVTPLEDVSLIQQTRHLLTQVETAYQAVRDLRRELVLYGRALQAQLAALEEAVGEPPTPRRELDNAPIPMIDEEGPRTPLPGKQLRRPLDPARAETPKPEPRTAPAAVPDPVKAAPEPPKPSRPDRRRAVRRQGPPVPLLLSYSKNGDDPFKGYVNDTSQTGLGVTVEWALPVSSILTVRPASKGGKWVQIEVRNCRKVRERWHLGCRFVAAMPTEEVKAFEP
jgi:hypothetical protein